MDESQTHLPLMVIGTDCIDRWKSKYNMIVAMETPCIEIIHIVILFIMIYN